MPLAAQILALVAAALHVLFFYLESIVFSKPSTWKGFGVESQEAADHIKPMALNQGFYNLFLAAGVFIGVIWQFATTPALDRLAWTSYAIQSDASKHQVTFLHTHFTPQWTSGVVIFALACMLAAAIVLIVSSKGKLLRAALIQGLVPAIALIIPAVA